VDDPSWEVPILIAYNEKCLKEDKSKSLLKPFYTKKQSEPERLFVEALEGSKKVKWWFKNGESERKYSAVLRNDDKGAFYPDFIVQFDDGTIGIFGSKAGRTAETSDAGQRETTENTKINLDSLELKSLRKPFALSRRRRDSAHEFSSSIPTSFKYDFVLPFLEFIERTTTVSRRSLLLFFSLVTSR